MCSAYQEGSFGGRLEGLQRSFGFAEGGVLSSHSPARFTNSTRYILLYLFILCSENATSRPKPGAQHRPQVGSHRPTQASRPTHRTLPRCHSGGPGPPQDRCCYRGCGQQGQVTSGPRQEGAGQGCIVHFETKPLVFFALKVWVA